MNNKERIDELNNTANLKDEDIRILLNTITEDEKEYIYSKARDKSIEYYGRDIYIRGLIEFTNYCKNDCYYCGIRRGNGKANRYRLTVSEILVCCSEGYRLGFRTFVLQGGEDGFYTDEILCKLIREIKNRFPDCAVTLSIGEKAYESYEAYYRAGADRYLLRHETADKKHYESIHPSEMSYENRRRCLMDLMNIGYQVGCGIMVGSPYQSSETIIKDIRFMQEIKPHMIGIGPFIPHEDTPFYDRIAGSLDSTLVLLAMLRLFFPYALLPATTALGTIHAKGREMGIMAGANVLMPNLSPKSVRDKYKLYNGKICTGEEAAECIECLKNRVNSIGYTIVSDRGDCKYK